MLIVKVDTVQVLFDNGIQPEIEDCPSHRQDYQFKNHQSDQQPFLYGMVYVLDFPIVSMARGHGLRWKVTHMS
jgi:hypothetical protein